MNLSVAGMDTASNRLHAIWTTGTSLAHPVELSVGPLKATNPDVRRASLYDAASGYFSKLPNGTHVFCEEPLALRNGKTTRLLCLAAGAVWAAHLSFDLYWHWVDVATWKKEAVGNGNADKPTVKEWCEKMGYFSDVEDLNDAFAINRYGAKALAKAGIGV